MQELLGFLDMRTIILTTVLTDLVCFVVMLLLWRQNRERLNGITYWVWDYGLQLLTIFLIVLRGIIPDWISIDVSNVLSLFGIFLGLKGLEKFFGIKVRNGFNIGLLVFFPILIVWSTQLSPSLNSRNLIISVFQLLFFVQYAWFLFRKLNRIQFQSAYLVATVFIGYCVLDFSRLADIFIFEHHSQNFMVSGSFNVFVMLSYKVLFLLLTYGLALMFNKHLLNEIVKEEEKFSKAFKTSPYAIVLTRVSDGRILEINEAFHQYSGYGPEDSIGATTSMLQIWENLDDREQVLNRLALNQPVRDMEFIFRRKDGALRTALFSADRLIIDGVLCMLSSINDITERKRAEEELKSSETQLRELNATKDKFFSILAHDLKGPFGNIIGFSMLLEESLKSKNYEHAEEYAEIIGKSTQRTMDLLMNLLDWSRTQTGRLEVNPEYIEINLLLVAVLELFDETAKQKDITIKTEHFPNATVYSDRILLSTILRNLVSNAIKFSNPGGTVVLSAHLKDGFMEICVRDHGVGIREEDKGKLFRINENITRKGTMNEHGTGLGLLLCKEFTEKQGGAIRVESQVDKGSSFYFTVPLNP